MAVSTRELPSSTGSITSGSIQSPIENSKSVSEKLREKATERQHNNEYVITTDFPLLETIREYTILGGFSWTLTKSKKRIIDESAVFDIGYGPQTPSEVARDYLLAKYQYPRRASKRQVESIHLPRSQAMYCVRGKLERAVYLDVRAAYFSIMQIVGCTPDYFPGRFLGAGDPPSDFPCPDHKIARNCLVSVGTSNTMQTWTGYGLDLKKSWNSVYNMGLWALVQDVLHGVAADLIEKAGAIYFNVDGAIIPEVALNTGIDILRAWGLEGKVKHKGRAEVFGIGRYKVGRFRTRHMPALATGDFKAINNYCNRAELRRNMYILSKRAPLNI